jgi:Ion channel
LLYWAYGNNFSYRLAHLDAVYVALGNLATAGTGNLVPVDQASRVIVSVQYIVDLVYVAVILSIGVNKLIVSAAAAKAGAKD